MLPEETSRSRKPSTTQNQIRFVPRQVLLVPKSAMADSKLDKKNNKGDDNVKRKKEEKKKKEKKAKSSEEETLAVDLPKKGEKNLKGHLLSSIAAFLESSGFHRTLAVFRSETEIENAGLSASFINLEDLFCKHSVCSDGPAASAIDWSKENGDISKKDEGEGIRDASEHIRKKKRKHKNESDGEIKQGTNEQALEDDSINFKVKSTELGDAEDLKKIKIAKESPVETKDKKRKKKSIYDSHENAETDLLNVICETVQDTDIIVPKSDMKGETKRKNKHKNSSDAGNRDTNHENHKISKEIVEEQIGELNSLMNSSSALPAETDTEHKAKKKKKKVPSNLTAENGKEEQVKSGAGKGNITVSEEKLDNSQKQRKRNKGPEGGASLVENKTVTKESKYVEVERDEDNKKTCSLLTSEKSDCKPIAVDEKKAEKSCEKGSGEQHVTNGDLEKNEEVGVSSANSTKKEKRSAEPRTINAFQRVKVDEVKFADQRLQDNSYWALDEKGSGYGAKAQEVLGQVRGRDFRHEKTKKKRGTYRGGHIDFQTHSIKFNSDDDE